MESINYSVIIRTTGKAHLKYQKLLESVSRLVPQPKEVLVVLPEGNELPKEQLGYEKFLFCHKGMVRQRMEGLSACTTDYALFCDDDVIFPTDFVRKLHAPLKEGYSFFSAAPLYSFLPEKGKNTLINMLMGGAMPMILHRKTRYVTVLKSTGYSYNRKLIRSAGQYYETQSAPWTCFYADIRAFRLLELDKETWLDDHGYSAFDDQTMFYKAWIMGLKTVIVADTTYEHLDAKTSTKNNRPAVLYSRSFNRLVFWHRFIYSRQNSLIGRILAWFALGYRLTLIDLECGVNLLRKHMSWEDFSIHRKGLRDGKKYLKSNEYRCLPPVVRGQENENARDNNF